MLTEDAYAPWHLFPSYFDLHTFYLLRPVFLRIVGVSGEICNLNLGTTILLSHRKYINTHTNTESKNIQETELSDAVRLSAADIIIRTRTNDIHSS